jgi:hypothetical protein
VKVPTIQALKPRKRKKGMQSLIHYKLSYYIIHYVLAVFLVSKSPRASMSNEALVQTRSGHP